MEPRLKSQVFIDAYFRQVRAGDGFVTIVRKGDEDAGLIFIKLFISPQKTQIYQQYFDISGMRRFKPVFDEMVPENEVDAVLLKESGFDPDIWIIEVEHRKGMHFLEDYLLPSGHI